MLNSSTQNRKIVNVPNRITSHHVQEAFHYVNHELKLRSKKARVYSIESVYKLIWEQYPAFPIYTLFSNADFFQGEPSPIPTAFMFENGFAGKLSDIMEFTEAEKKKDKFYVTEKGFCFLLMVLGRLRDEIINNIFYRV